MERTDRLPFKTWWSWINVRDAIFFVFRAIEREISLSSNATLIQSELMRLFFITYDTRKRFFCSLRAKTLSFDCTFQCFSFKKDMASDILVNFELSFSVFIPNTPRNRAISYTKLNRDRTKCHEKRMQTHVARFPLLCLNLTRSV